MSFDTLGGAQALAALLTGLDGMGSVQIGVPESTGTRVAAYVTAASQTLLRKTTGTMQRPTRYLVTLAYRVDGSESTAEQSLMAMLDLFLAALHADLTLGGVATGAEVDMGLADAPEYQLRAGKEFREYPILVTLTQVGSYAVNP